MRTNDRRLGARRPDKRCVRCWRTGIRMFTPTADGHVCTAERECRQRMIENETGRRPDRTWGPHWK